MKTNKIIVWIIVYISLTSCFKDTYQIITRVNRDGSCNREIYPKNDSISTLFPYDYSSGWKISQIDTVIEENLAQKHIKYLKLSKKFNSVDELSTGLRHDNIFPTPKESLKKRFRWFFTYYTFVATYPEVTDKGRVPIDKYLSKAEQKFFLQGDMSAYKGMNGYELKDELDHMETKFMKWYYRSLSEESFDVVLNYVDANFRLQLPAIKDTLFAISEKQEKEYYLDIKDICTMLDEYFNVDNFSELHAENKSEMDDMLEERTKTTDQLSGFDIQYDLVMPGKIVATNTDLQNNDTLTWHINLFRFLADDYTLTAESRTANIWAFAVTLLLAAFSVYCFCRYFR